MQILRVLILGLLFCVNICTAQGICTTAGSTADSLIQYLPRDSTSFQILGVLYTNGLFLNHSFNREQDADSAVYYLEKAIKYQSTPELQAYLCIAQALRAREDNFWQKFSGQTMAKVEKAFTKCDSLSKEYPDDFAVQFLAANLFVEADKLSQKNYYWERGLNIYQALFQFSQAESLLIFYPGRNFFTDEVRANILLNDAKLELKLAKKEEGVIVLVRLKWQAVIMCYPYTMAAINAKKQLDETK
jgi:hypothetical protein